MNVKELFHKADEHKVFDAYLLIYGDPTGDDSHTIQEKLPALEKFRLAVYANCKKFRECEPTPPEHPTTIFILKYASHWWDERGETVYDTTAIYNKEALEFLKQNPAEDSECNIANYGIDMMPLKTLAACEIADASVEELGVETCCAVIFSEFFYFGYTEEARSENIEDLNKELRERIQDLEEHPENSIPAEEVFAEIYQKMLDNCETEDERRYMILENEFEKATKDIRDRHAEHIMKDNRRIFVEAIRTQFSQNGA